MNPLLQRLADWRRERRIRRLGAECLRLYKADLRDAARTAGDQMMQECRDRSPQQVARMERALNRRLGLKAKS